jgi:uncharacterized protein (DUF2164 family)
MPVRSSPPITLPDEGRERALASLRQFFAEELEMPLGDLKAMLVLDHILTEHGPAIYNQAVADARKVLAERVTDLSDVLYRAEFPRWARTARGHRGGGASG